MIKLTKSKRIDYINKLNNLFFPDYEHINKFKKILNYTLLVFFICISLVLALLQRFISPLILIRIGKIYNHRLGHFILEYDWYNTQKNDNFQKQIRKLPFYFDLFFLSSSSSNSYFDQVTKNNLNIIPREIILGIFILNKHFLKNKKYLVNFPIRPTDLSYLDDKPPGHILSSKENDFGKIELEKLGINTNQEIVCFFVRDAAYEKYFFPDKDHNFSTYRNSNSTPFEKSMEFLAVKGFAVFRMGKSAEKSLEVRHPNIIDYPFSKIKSDFMDFYLSSKCKFAVATDSGAMMLPILFRKPLFLANVPSFHGLLQGNCVTLFQFKTFIDLDSGDEISLTDLLKRNFRMIDSSHGFETARIGHLENSSDEILHSIVEMLELLDSNTNSKIKYQKSQQVLNLRLNSIISKEITGLLSNSWVGKHPIFLD
jgi:putative glycosyltransferase (TIGR04372 family)